jgi:hypothetical protein
MTLNWDTDRDIEPFLAQPKLLEDFLGQKMDVIREAKSPEEKHAVIWCVSNLIPLQQFQMEELNVIFYENLCIKPEAEVARLCQSIKLDYHSSLVSALEAPSTTTVLSSAVVTGANRVNSWQNKLTSRQIDNILSVVRAFGLDYLYGDSITPLACG